MMKILAEHDSNGDFYIYDGNLIEGNLFSLSSSIFQNRDWIYDYYFTDTTLTLLLFDRVILLRKRKNHFNFEREQKLPRPAHFINHDDDKFVLSFAGLINNKNEKNKSHFTRTR